MESKRKRGRPVGYRKSNPRREYIHIAATLEEKELYKALGGAEWFRLMLSPSQKAGSVLSANNTLF